MPGTKLQPAGPMRSGTGLEFSNSAPRSNNAERLQPAFSGDGRGAVRSGIARLDDTLPAARLGQQDTRFVPGWGQCAPGAGGADGGVVRPVGGRHGDGTPRFDQAVGPGAYLWWYVDAISDDGQHALSIIAFVGSVFSPYYAQAFAKKGAAVDAQNHCAINVALYGPGSRRWAMTERSSASVARSSDQLVIGPSQLKWTGDHLQIDLNEVSVPLPKRLLGTVRVYPRALCNYVNALDDQGKHHWGPIAPCARVEVDFAKPGLSWKGSGYLDSNEGTEPATKPFKTWDWSRAPMADGSTAVIYDVTQVNGARTLLAERFKPDGSWESFTPAAQREKLASTLWRIDRGIRSDGSTSSAGSTTPVPTQVIETLEDTPFYARTLLKTQLLGERVTVMHETLEPQRLNSLPVRMMLPWRMPRRA